MNTSSSCGASSNSLVKSCPGKCKFSCMSNRHFGQSVTSYTMPLKAMNLRVPRSPVLRHNSKMETMRSGMFIRGDYIFQSREILTRVMPICELREKTFKIRSLNENSEFSQNSEFSLFFDLLCQRTSNADVRAEIGWVQFKARVNADVPACAAKNIP